MIEPAFTELVEVVAARRACELLGKARSTHYRRQLPPVAGPPQPRPTPPNALSEAERQQILAVLRSEEYCDLAPAQVWAPVVGESILDRLLNSSHHVFMSGKSYRPSRRPGRSPAPKSPTKTT